MFFFLLEPSMFPEVGVVTIVLNLLEKLIGWADYLYWRKFEVKTLF